MISYSISKHHVCFPNKVLSGQVGHIYNITLDEPYDNGSVVGRGEWIAFDEYAVAEAPTYEGVIREQAADGNWYVEVTKIDPLNPPILLCEVEIMPGYETTEFQDLANFYNAKGDTVRGYSLTVGDIYELSVDAFQGTPAAKKKVTISGQLHVVGA